jgi:hypothetical protein
MKKAIIFLGLVCCITGFSCTPDKCCAPPVHSDFTATKNGSGWQVFDASGSIRQDTLIIADTTVMPDHSELIRFKVKFNGTGDYTVAADNIAYGYELQMDNPYVHYTLDSGYANSLKVTYYIADAGFISGTFNIKLNKDPANTDTRFPASVTFLNGSFNIHLSK